MPAESNAGNPMGTERVSGLVLRTGVPLMISLLINSLYNFVDSVFVSRISEEALTALSLAAPVQILMSAMGLGIAVGLNAVISKALGEGDQEKVKKTASAALVLAFLAFVLAEAVVIPIGIILWRRESDKVLKNLGLEENRRLEAQNKNTNKLTGRQMLVQ